MCMYVCIYIYIYIYEIILYVEAVKSTGSALAYASEECPINSRNTPGLRYKIPVFSDPDPGKSWLLPMKTTISEQPRPWRKSCDGESCDGDRVYTMIHN